MELPLRIMLPTKYYCVVECSKSHCRLTIVLIPPAYPMSRLDVKMWQLPNRCSSAPPDATKVSCRHKISGKPPAAPSTHASLSPVNPCTFQLTSVTFWWLASHSSTGWWRGEAGADEGPSLASSKISISSCSCGGSVVVGGG